MIEKANPPDIKKTAIKTAPITSFVINEGNPRRISRHDLEKLKQSITNLPSMLTIRPIVVDNDESMHVLAGTMRLLACRELGYTELPYTSSGYSLGSAEADRFILADNYQAGEWLPAKLLPFDISLLEAYDLDGEVKNLLTDKPIVDDCDHPATAVQLLPEDEYVIIRCPPDSPEWADLCATLRLSVVRDGGYDYGDIRDTVRLERVLSWERVKNMVVK